ncbi:protein adenylyltransferase SelO [Bdellovibrio reynosensis]|uniref:Protein nucleotidyltransferase YdiU n=1 Tax=Bdellovibrio reynosensis TaxID=2835041 RepID=A0ABY4CEY0_9BACT|nr:YdiU family protein [Bdellovibrio reynosensis]UOF02447.1 YdiU family protein [Bdellovibrio reynosensis]
MSDDKNQFGWNFDNTYARLSDVFFERINPTPARSPHMVMFNEDLARTLGLNVSALSKEGQNYFAGNSLFDGSEPLAQAYAGHQFGHINMLGDGRANLLGEHVTAKGQRFDIQLKGAGRTRFSRRGDGLAALGPMLREYIISEAMFALNIPTTRSLAVVTTGEQVIRETSLPGAVLTRVASSHLRVGTFEYAAGVEKGKYLRELADYTIQRHYPELASQPEPYVGLLKAVIERQASLIVKWMQVGFVHGVMNTDNMTISGETIDYGPCAFMDRFSLSTVFSSIDTQGRYSYGQQPSIGQWNLTRFAETLLPLFSTNQEEAIAKAEAALDTYAEHLSRYWVSGMRGKLGLVKEGEDDMSLFNSLLEMMERNQADYTNTFRALSEGKMLDEPLFKDGEFVEWYKAWQALNPDLELMKSRNPAVIPRNHMVEKALAAAVEKDDYSVAQRLLDIVRNPFVEPGDGDEFKRPANDEGYQTFCGT